MAKLKAPLAEINDALKQLLKVNPMGYEIDDFNRAAQLAQHIGFQNINDCLHVALAEARGCAELIPTIAKTLSACNRSLRSRLSFCELSVGIRFTWV